MTDLERDILLKERNGSLEDCNLWSFWDGLTFENQRNILEYFENTPLFFDYKTLFKGASKNDLYHGVISTMGILFVNIDLKCADQFFFNFLEFTPKNYSFNSMWGKNWEKEKISAIEIWEHIVKRADHSEIKIQLENLEKVKMLTVEDIYWTDAHFFVQNHSEFVYKSYLNGECNIARFENAFNFCYNNIDNIKTSITKVYGWDKPLSNGIVEQYLTYLEKDRQYDRCIDIIDKMKGKGWRNDFEKRLARCILKKTKG